jgi:hypothetical protein
MKESSVNTDQFLQVPRPNEAASVYAPTRVCLRSLRLGRRATEQRC